MDRVAPSGMFLVEGSEKFLVRGVSYGPFRPRGTDEPFPAPAVVKNDFALLRELGGNTLRVYHVPPPWLVDLAHELGLRLLVGVPWAQHIRFLDSARDRREVRARVRWAATQLRGAQNLLALLVGNEISPQIVRWYGPARIERFLSDLADEARQADPEALISYANFPMTEYLDVGFADLVCFNVYLHREPELRRYVARLQNVSDFRPLVLSEFGIDSLREGERVQADVVSRTAEIATELGCAGTVVFSFTDEWFTGGHEIEDWAFGLVRRDREPKPAYRSLQRVYRATFPPPPRPAPRVSVVICAYQAERTLEECLDSLRRLRYPDFEVIVVDDGSTDATRSIAERYPEFRLICQENRGLSAARNVGIEAATGEVVAYTDADCAVDPDWLTFLVQRLVSENFAGVGGPNLPPPEDEWTAEVVARSPGGPTHVLVTDSEAEHVPGCNMAFWRKHLTDVGLFDPVYRTAGDDVDICWRLQNEGYRIGYAPAALVWHRRRHTVTAYLKQQMGYGRAESLLSFKHPHRFNGLGQSRWFGRIYGGTGRALLRGGHVIYGGPFGSGLFQTLYEPPGSVIRSLPSSFEWNAAALALVGAGIASHLLGFFLPTVLVAGVVLFGISIGQAVSTALRVSVPRPVGRARALVALLSYLGPLVRAVERHTTRFQGYSRVENVWMTEPAQQPRVDLLRRSVSLSYWNETGIEKQTCLGALLDVLHKRQFAVIVDNGWKTWDLCIRRIWVRGRINVLVQNHGGSRRQVDFGMTLRGTKTGSLLRAGCASLALLGLVTGQPLAVATGLAAALATEALLLGASLRLGRSFRDVMQTCAGSLPIDPLGRPDGGPSDSGSPG